MTPETHPITLVLDADDHRDFMAELEIRKDRPLPDGDSCDIGAHVGEMIRDLWEYRALREVDRKAQEPTA